MNIGFLSLSGHPKKETKVEIRKIEMTNSGYNTYVHGSVTKKLPV
jgi:hypothetical protein